MLKKYQVGTMIPLAGPQGETIENIEAVQPEPIEPIEDLSEFIGSLSDIASPETTQVSIPFVPNNILIDAENMDVTEFFNTYGKLPQEAELEAMSQEKVPMERYDMPSSAPNIYRENLSKVMFNGMSVEECAAGMHHALRSENTDNRVSHDYRKNVLGISGNAWHTGKNIINHGGERIYGLHGANTGVNSARTNSGLRAALISNRSSQDLDAVLEDMRVGDVVEMFYPGSGSQNDAFASGNEVHTTHIGMVSVDADGNKYVTHNIHGTWHTDDASKLLKRSNGYFIAGIVRPAYTQETGAVKISDGSMNYKRSSGKTTAIERTPEERQAWEDKLTSSGRKSRIQPFLNGLEYYAPYIQEDTGVSNEDMANLIMPVSYALYGLESGFNNPKSDFGEKAPFRNFWRGLKESGRPLTQSIGLGDLGGLLDPMSEGPTQIKLGQGFPASDPGKAFMERYGVNEETIYDPSVAASITQMLTIHNMNHLKSVIGASRFNALPIETKRNLLFKAHNKGIENVIKKDLGEKVGEDKYKLTPESIDAGLKIYSDLHIVSEEPYTNNGNDYALEISIDYDKVLAQHEEAARMGYNVRPYATMGEIAEEAYGDAKSTVEASAYSVLQDGKNQLQNIQSQSKKAAKQGYTTLNNEIKKKLLTPAEAEGEKAFANMMTLGTIAGERGEQLQKELTTPISETTQERIQRVSKALEHDIDNYTRETYDVLDSLDVPEAVSRKTPVGKIISKVTEINNATDSIPDVMSSSPEIVREFNEAIDSVGEVLPFSVQAEILNDPRVLSGAITVRQRIQEELSGEPIEEAIENIEDLPVDSLPDLEYLQRNQDIGELVSMRDGGYLPKYQVGTTPRTIRTSDLSEATRLIQAEQDSLRAYNAGLKDFNENIKGKTTHGQTKINTIQDLVVPDGGDYISIGEEDFDLTGTTEIKDDPDYYQFENTGIQPIAAVENHDGAYMYFKKPETTVEYVGGEKGLSEQDFVTPSQINSISATSKPTKPTNTPNSIEEISGKIVNEATGESWTKEEWEALKGKGSFGKAKQKAIRKETGGYLPKYQVGTNSFPQVTDKYGNKGTRVKLIGDIDQDTGKAYAAYAPLYSLPEATVTAKLDRTNPTAVKNWSRKNDPIAYEAREATSRAADAINTVGDFLPGYGDARDAMYAMYVGSQIQQGNFKDLGDLGIDAALAALPLIGYNSAKEIRKFIKKDDLIKKYGNPPAGTEIHEPMNADAFYVDPYNENIEDITKKSFKDVPTIIMRPGLEDVSPKEIWKGRSKEELMTQRYSNPPGLSRKPQRAAWFSRGNEWSDALDRIGYQQANSGTRYELDLDLKDVLLLENMDDMAQFTKQYGRQSIASKGSDSIDLIDWKEVSDKHKGIEIWPFQSKAHGYDADSMFDWYYGWDAGSGALWDSSTFKNSKRIPGKFDKKRIDIGGWDYGFRSGGYLPKYQDGTNWFSKGWDYLFGDDEPEVKSINTGPTPAEVKAKQDSTAREYFKNYLREEEARPSVMAAENSAIRKPGGGYYKKREDGIFYPYKLDKENKYTIGYGHSKKGVENFTKGITKEQAERFLEEDIDIAMRRTKEYVDNNPASPFYSDTTQSFETLDPQTQYMLADYPFNIGKLSKFKKYAGAVLSGDTTEAKLQYKRYANNDINQPLGRNKAYYDAYIEPWLETYRK